MASNALSIRLSTDGLSFCVLNPLAEDKRVCFDRDVDPLVPMAANLRAAIDADPRLQETYGRVNVAVAGGRYTLLPLESFEDELSDAAFRYNLTPRRGERVMYNVLQVGNAVVMFGIDTAVADVVADRYPDARFYAQSAPLIDLFAVRSRAGNCRKLYAFVSRDTLDIYAFDRGRLLMANSFAAGCTDDRVYYLMYAFRGLGLDRERDELWLSGRIPDKQPLIDTLRQYVRRANVLSASVDLDLQAMELCG